ncbi:glycerophosphodiester phosphodiesterase family protein [Primorskyibacter sp. S187A]|uniref:glycerophosphodiester phosphodiesterase family protein n=1 Tax=Primorskyibacter sp. S187A TaxID=3415130 RepID=UPI003C7C051C
MIALPAGFLNQAFAHRGLHGAGRPENSMSAVKAAVEAGYGIEIDVQPSADGVAMVFHDDALERLTGKPGPVTSESADRLARLPLLGGAGEGVPTLSEVLEIVAGRVPLLVEIKDQDGALGPNVGLLEEAVAACVHTYEGPLAVMSFNPHSVACMRDAAPDVPRGLTTCAFGEADWPQVPQARRAAHARFSMMEDIEASFISHQADDLTSPEVARVIDAGYPVLCWTIRSANEEAAARRYADTITFEGYTP